MTSPINLTSPPFSKTRRKPSKPTGSDKTDRRTFRGWINADRSKDPRPSGYALAIWMAEMGTAMNEIGENINEAFDPNPYPRGSFLWWVEKINRKNRRNATL
jgi:hypothetical protein